MFYEKLKIVPMGSYLDMGSTVVTESVNCKNLHRGTLVFIFHDIGTASPVLTVHSGATTGAMTSDLTFRYAWGSAATLSATADVLGATSTSAALTITHGTYDNFMLCVDVDMSDMDIDNNEFWLTAEFTDPGTATGHVTCIGVFEPRYPENQSASVMA